MKHRQLLLATILVAFGVLLITAAFIVPPTGVIDPTVLTAFKSEAQPINGWASLFYQDKILVICCEA